MNKLHEILIVSDIAIFVLKRDVKLQLTNSWNFEKWLWVHKAINYIWGKLCLIHSVRWKMSTSQSAVMFCSWVVKTGVAYYGRPM